jgi:hypothetical protein
MIRKFTLLWAILLILLIQMGPPPNAQADVAGRLTLVEGRVDLLRDGKLPATPVKIDDKVQLGDVLRTKSLSKAEITFVDNSTMMISPESRVAIEEFMFDPNQKKRNAVIKLFQGLAHVVVQKVYQEATPDFVIKTTTAIVGIRGTEFGIRLQPNNSTIMNFRGVLQVGNIFPEVGQLFRRAFKIAFAWGGDAQKWVFLKDMQGTTVGRGLPPTLPFTITPQDRQQFMNQLASGLISRREGRKSGGGSPATVISTFDSTATGGTETTDQGVGSLGTGVNPMVSNLLVTTPPILTPTATTPAPTTTSPTSSTPAKPPAHSGNR